MSNLSQSDFVWLIEIIHAGVWFTAALWLLVRPLIELAFRRWIPTTRPVPSSQAMAIRVVVLAILITPFFVLPQMRDAPVSNADIHWVEIGMLIWVGAITLWVMRGVISKIYALLPLFAKRIGTTSHALGSRDHTVQPYGAAKMSFGIQVSPLVFFATLYTLRSFDVIVLDWSHFSDGYDAFLLLLNSNDMNKQQWLSLAELFVTLVLAILIITLVIIPVCRRTFAEIPTPTSPPLSRYRRLFLILGMTLGIIAGLSVPI